MRRKDKFFQLVAGSLFLLLWGCAGFSLNPLEGALAYHNEEYGFSFMPPSGWKQNIMASQIFTEQVRREDKDATVINFGPSDKLEPSEVGVTAILKPGDAGRTSERRKERIKELKRDFGGRNQQFDLVERSIAGQPAVQMISCPDLEGNPECGFVHHITEIFAPQADIRIHFMLQKELYPRYKEAIERSIKSIKINPKASPFRTQQCQESDIQIVDHHWEEGGKTGGLDFPFTYIKWEALLKNIGLVRCSVRISYQLLDITDHVLFNDNLSTREVIEPEKEKKFVDYQDSIKTAELPKVHSSRVVITEIN